MSLNASPAELTQQAAVDLAKKMSLEGRLIRELRTFFKGVSADLFTSVSRTGTIQSVEKYRPIVQVLLANQYNDVTQSFVNSNVQSIRRLPKSNPLRQSLTKIAKASGTSFSSMMEDVALQARLTAIQAIPAEVVTSTEQILATTQKNLSASLNQATDILDDPSRHELAVESAKINQSKSTFRPNTISSTTTQQAAEQAKFFEQERLLALRNGSEAQEIGLEPATIESTWVSQGDSRVRDGDIFNHLLADFQIRVNGIYHVSGQQLRFPGDTFLGATASNVIHCRCASILTIEEPS